MNIKLMSMKIANFKGIKNLAIDFDGDTMIKAENGVGKTTVYDAFLWLWFGKDSTGRKEFQLRPLDDENRQIKGLVLSVETEMEIDGEFHIFKKEHHEKVVKDQLRGYETLCWIDDVPKKIGEYSDYIKGMIPEDTFKLLTDLGYFNDKMNWTSRRNILLEIAGDTGTPEGFAELNALLNKRSVDDYKKVLADQKKRMVKERDEINPRIDEIEHGGDDYASSSIADVIEKRQIVKSKIESLEKLRHNLSKQENARQSLRGDLNKLKSSKVDRENEMKSDTIAVQGLIDDKNKIEKDVAAKRLAVTSAKAEWTTTETNLSTLRIGVDGHTDALLTIQKNYRTTREAPTDNVCYACGAPLSAETLAKVEKAQHKSLTSIAARGNETKELIDTFTAEVAKLEVKSNEQKIVIIKAQDDLVKTEKYKVTRFAEINEALNNKPVPNFETDSTWFSINEQIARTEIEIGDPVSEQLVGINSEREIKIDELAELDKSLAQMDRKKQDEARIEELKDRERVLAQQITDMDKQLDVISQYKTEQNRLIETAVNGKFANVTFKLFKENLNGSTEDCCESLWNGVPFNDLSSGQKIYIGLDIVNVLGKFYKASAPIFVDHAESMTMAIQSDSQIVLLYAELGVKELAVTKREAVK